MFAAPRYFWLAAVLGAMVLRPVGVTAQAPDGPPLPPHPAAKSPVEAFRELLNMSLAERRQVLSNRPPEIQRRVLAKVREYESLKESDRNVRLQATELRWYLLPLMGMPAANRAAHLEHIPVEVRKLVEERLNQWNLLPPPLQQEMLNDEKAAKYFARLESVTEKQKQTILNQMSPERRARMEADLARWTGLSEEERGKRLAAFNRIFELNNREQRKALSTLSDAERQQMEKTMHLFEKLPLRQREQCIRSFQKFSTMAPAERELFFKNVVEWKRLSSAERQAWRNLVRMVPVQPPLPPGMKPSPISSLSSDSMAVN